MTNKTGGTNTTKDVIYIDVDDEITGIIDKVQSSGKKIVALVLPKRATVLQSVVNMKLLKRAAGEAKKSLVLITAESGLLPLAGSVGIHVAKSLNSKPEIPETPGDAAVKLGSGEDVEEIEDVDVDANRTVGELSGAAPLEDDDEAIELDDEDAGGATDTASKPSKDETPKKNKKFKIPNFNKFRVLLVFGAIGVLLLGMVGYAALAVWPRATVTIKTNSETINSSVVLTLKTGADVKLDATQGVVPAQLQEVKKTLSQEAPATGQLNKGEKAAGALSITARKCSGNPFVVPSALPSGSGLSSNGQTYITQESTTFVGTGSSGGCYEYAGTGTTDVAAQSPGAKYNVSSATFTVAGRADVTATGSTTGGTDSIVKVVSQVDIDTAKQKITEQDNKPIQQELKSALIGRGLFPLEASFGAGAPETKLSAEANTAADVVTVTQTINYTMLGSSQEDLEKVIASDVEKKIDTKKQTILSHGLDDAFFSLQAANPDGALLSMQVTAVAGAELNIDTVKTQVAGKKAGDAKEIISAYPGVTDVIVEYSPFWVASIPKKTDKITVVVEEPKATADDTESSP